MSLRQRDERGSTLVLAMVMIIVVAVAGAAVLNQQNSASNVQSIYTDLRTVQLSLDSQLDSTIQGIRYDPFAAMPGSGSTCDNTSDWGPSLQTVTVGTKSYELHCQADPSSNAPLAASGTVPDNAILTLGGIAAQGTLWDPLWTQADYNSYWPFCDDFHNFQGTGSGGGGRCEAGLFVGKNVTTNDTSVGGLYVKSNGAAGTSPIVAVNGSIVTSDKGGVARTLTVDGPRDVWARRYCGWGAGWGTLGFTAGNGTAPSLKQYDYIKAGWDPTTSTTDDVNHLKCSQGLNQTAASNNLKVDPDLLPEPFDPKALPKVDAGQPVASGYMLTAALCSSQKGVVVMPAAKIGTQQPTPGGPTYPVYGAWYDSAKSLQDMMNDATCAGQLFWFRPGVYDFDFLDVGTPTKWTAARGCIPTDACGDAPSEIFGGLPVYDWTNGTAGSNFCIKGTGMPNDMSTDYTQAALNANIASGNCVQPMRVMTPQTNAGVNTNDWTNQTTNNEVTDAQTIDNVAAVSNLNGSGHQDTQLVSDELQMPIPQNPGTQVTSIKLEVPYQLIDNSSQIGATFTDPSMDANALGRGADVEVRSPSGSCWLFLPADNLPHTGTTRGTDGRLHATDSKAIFDLTNGCDSSLSGRILKVSGGANPFPTGSIATGGNGDTLAAHPAWINVLKVIVHAHIPTTVPTAKVLVDGVQFAVQWKGRPAPSFPDGCDRTLPGVQWVFNGTARIDWGNQGNNGMYAELCGNRPDQFPNWTGAPACAAPVSTDPCYKIVKGHDYSTAIFGMTEDAAGPPDLISTESSGQQTTSQSLLPLPRAGAPLHQMATTRVFGTNTLERFFASSLGGAPVPADYRDADSQYATANWGPGSTTNQPATLSFRLPGPATGTRLVCDATNAQLLAYPTNCPANTIPAGSQITNVQLVVRHREGKVGDLTCWGACISKVQVQLDTQNVGIGSNGYGGSDWNSTSAVPNGWIQGTTPGTASPDIPICHAGAGQWCTDRWGVWSATSYPDWSLQRNLTDSFASPESLEDAIVTYTVTARDTGVVNHLAELDKLAVIVQYRPPTAPRPLAGCLTTRVGTFQDGAGNTLPPSWFEGSGTDSSKYNGGGHDWLDNDWAINQQSAGAAYVGDASFGNYSTGNGASAGNGPTKEACPLLEVVSANGSTPVIKFHVEGTLYSPSAALEFSGNDNDAAWVSDGIIARHMSALRWKNSSSDLPAVGGANIAQTDRILNLALCDPEPTHRCPSGTVRLSARVRFTDWDPVLHQAAVGSAVKILSWKRNPS